jgi:hypothetical protein
VIPFCFYVIRSLSYNVVLGCDFLKSSGACINCAEHRISLFDGLVQTSLTGQSDKSVVLKLAQDITIPSATEAIVKLAVPKRFQHRLGILETYAPIKNRFLLVAGTLIHPEGDTTLCKILNTGLKPQRLRVKTPIAQIGQIDLIDPFNRAMLCVDLPDNLQSENNVKMHSLPSHEERVRIFESKGITLDNPNLTLDQFSELTALLFEYQDLFCSAYEQLPTSRLPPYRIELTNNRLVRQKRYPLSLQQERLLEQYTDKLLQAKIVEPSTSP